jgi:hypothetical protein
MSEYRMIFLIGAARSGTKLVRDVIATHPAIDRVPYDINYIWRLGNEHLQDDQLPVASITPTIRARIQQRITEDYHHGAPFLIEKTVSNCLRIPFLHALYPDALFIYLLRDGRDVVESSMRQWTARPDWRYILRKIRTFPLLSAPTYALRYAFSTVQRLTVNQQTIPTSWGPRYAGIDDDLRTVDLLEVCARQWLRCVELAEHDLGQLPSEQVMTIRYETFVRDPLADLQTLAAKIGISAYDERMIAGMVSAAYIGRGVQTLPAQQREQLEQVIGTVCDRLGYPASSVDGRDV